MNLVKVTTSGQITIPTEIRRKFATKIFVCELVEEGFLFRPVQVQAAKAKKHKYTMEEFKKWKIKDTKCPEETNLADKLDEIVYTF